LDGNGLTTRSGGTGGAPGSDGTAGFSGIVYLYY
jgi:hypothetical protein